MSLLERIRWFSIGFFGKFILWVWIKTCRLTVLGEENYQKLRERKKPVVILVWHGRIFLVPYFFRSRGVAPLVSPSKDGEIVAQIMARWGYRIIRGSSSHAIIKAWNRMKSELHEGGEVIIVPDGPKGPVRRMKIGGLKLAQETGAYLVPFTFSGSKQKRLNSWDRFLMVPPFSKVVVVFGEPVFLASELSGEKLEKERERLEAVMIEMDEKADRFFI